MPGNKGLNKKSGDVHLPDIESDDLPLEEASTASLGEEGTQSGRGARGLPKAGLVKDPDQDDRPTNPANSDKS